MAITRRKRNGLWVARGYPSVDNSGLPPNNNEGNPRDNLVYGTYKPTYSLVGPRAGIPLTNYNSPSTTTLTLPAGGGVIENKVIYGDLVAHSDGKKWTIKNCLLRGGSHAPASDVGLITCFKQRVGSNTTTWSDDGVIHLIDCELRPQRPANGRNGAVGHNFIIERCLFTGGMVDCVSTHVKSGSTTVGTWAKVKVLGSILEKTAYTFPDLITTTHTDGTHNDLWQHQGGDAIVSIGNWFNGVGGGYTAESQAYPDYPWMPDRWVTGGGLLVQSNGGMAKTTAANTFVTDNWFNGGKFHLVWHSGCNATLSGNKHTVDVAMRGANGALGSNYNGSQIWVSAGTGGLVGIETSMTSTAIDGPGAGQPLEEFTGRPGTLSGRVWKTPYWPQGMTDASGRTY